MGTLLSKFTRKQKGTYDLLEDLENKIKHIEECQREEQAEKETIDHILVFSVSTYFIIGSNVIFIVHYFNLADVFSKIFYIVSGALLPIPLIFFEKVFFIWKTRNNREKLILLKNQKKKILDEVMNKETYNVAKSILEKFAPEIISTLNSNNNNPNIQAEMLEYPFPFNQLSMIRTPEIFSDSGLSAPSSQQLTIFKSTIMPLPQPILSRNRSFIDKVVDYLVGDGPSNRYALICKKCFSHNGMALKEEFEYLSFKCSYCFTFNPARKQRLPGPLIEEETANNNNDHAEDNNEGNVTITELNDSEREINDQGASNKQAINPKKNGA